MTLGEMIATLNRKDPEKEIAFEFGYFQPIGLESYRGYYDQLAINYGRRDSHVTATVGGFLAKLKDARGKIFTGYKGGEFAMDDGTAMWVDNNGDASGTAVTDIVDGEYSIYIRTARID